MVALVLSMSWKTLPHLPVEADLWAALPDPLLPDVAEPLPEPEPEPAPPPVVKPQVNEADIALQKAQKEKEQEKEKTLRAEEELRESNEARKLEETRLQEESRKAGEKLRVEELAEKERVERIKVEMKRKLEQEMARQVQAELENEEIQMKAVQQQAARASRNEKVVEDFKHRIQTKVQSYVRLPQSIKGNPEAVFQVTLLPNGEVRHVTLVKSSGQPAYDVEVERAILKASPLPLPNEKEAAAVFRAGLMLKFRPF
jgi:colicin import membrane protein